MKKKVLSLVLTAAMMTTMLAGCGSSDNGSTAASTGEAPAAATTEAAAASTEAAPAEEVTLKWGEKTTVEFENELKKGNLRIIKVDKDNNEILLEGVKFGIYDKNGKLVKEVVTDEKGEVNINDLPTCENLKVSQGKYEGVY